MADKYSTIQQHQPLRVPSSFDKQGRALIAQLEEILDDIYRRFGRLRFEDMGKDFRKRIEDDEGNYSQISQEVEEISLEVGGIDGTLSSVGITSAGIDLNANKYIKINSGSELDIKSGGDLNIESGGNMEIASGGALTIKSGEDTGIVLDGNGIDMQTAGKVNILAANASNSSILFGSEEDANFSVGINGEMYSKTVNTDALSVGGLSMPGIVVAESQPDGHNVLWFKPSSSTEKQWNFTPSSNYLDQTGGIGYYQDFLIPYAPADHLSGDLYYGIDVSLIVYSLSSSQRVTLKASIWDGTNWIEIGSTDPMCYSAFTTVTLNVMKSQTEDNVMNVSGGNFTVRIETDYPPTKCRLTGAFTLKARTTSTSGASACSVYYLS